MSFLLVVGISFERRVIIYSECYHNNMEIMLPFPVLSIVKTIIDAGYTCEIVGGAVRDILLGIPTHDWDFATNGKPEEIMPLFTDSFYENNFGTVMVAQKHLKVQFDFEAPENEDDLVFDITTYRSDGLYRNFRHPDKVIWGTSIEEDLKRRDFTINAMALKAKIPSGKVSSSKITCDVIDPFGGQEDLKQKLIRTVGNPDERFSEDALRMLRAVRLAVKLEMKIEETTRVSIRNHAHLLPNISWERISEEFMRVLVAEHPDHGIILLDELGLLQNILPELLETKGVKQSGHHIYDVWEHSIRALSSCPSRDPVVRLSTLLHDIAKPATAKQTSHGTITFYSHEVIGARIAKKIAQRLRLSKKDCDRVFTLVRWHMFTYEKHVTDAYIRRFIRRIGTENIEEMMALRTGDRIGSGSKASSWRLEEMKQRIFSELHQPLKLTDMAINGNDVMKELKIKPGPVIGQVLNALFEDVLENPEHNTLEYLIAKMKRVIKK